MLTLRQILKRYRCNQTITATDAAIVKQSLLDSTAFSDIVKARAEGAWYCIRPTGQRAVKMLHMCYAKDGDTGAIPLPLGKLEARPAKRIVKPRSSTERNKVLEACRAVIQPDIDRFREAFWQLHFDAVEAAASAGEQIPCYPRCPVSGKSLWSNKTHVDHVYPFVRLVDDWLAESSLSFEQITCSRKRSLGRMSMGDTLDKSWYDYHAQHAELRLIEARANMSKGAKV